MVIRGAAHSWDSSESFNYMKIPISDKVFLLKGKTPFPYCNCLLFEDNTRTVIDTGMTPPVIYETSPDAIDLVLNSHAHVDHMHGNWAFNNARIGFHTTATPAAQAGEDFGRDYILGMWSRLMSTPLNLEYLIDRPQDALIFKDSLLVSFPASRVDFSFNHGDEFDLGKVKLRAIHAPGHCRGHCCFYWEKEGILFTSDIDFTEGGPWYFNESADIDEFINSIRQIMLINPRIIVPGHGRVVEAAMEKTALEYLEHIYRREERILVMLDQPRTLEEMTGKNLIYSEYIRPTLLFWERVMIFKHLNRLIKLGEVNQKDDFYYRV